MPTKERLNAAPQATQEFLLVAVMLIALVVLIYIVLVFPPRIDGVNNDTTEILNYRKDNLAVILTAFGAWIGAGAAYFFGRESLKQTSDILSMQVSSPKEKLKKLSLRDASPQSLGWAVTAEDNLKIVKYKLKFDSKRWFVIILKEDRTLDRIIHEDAFWRFIDEHYEQGTPYEQILEKKVSEVLDYINTNQLQEDLVVDYVPVRIDTSALDADNSMQQKGSYLAIIMNSEEKPTNFITRDDIRELILKID